MAYSLCFLLVAAGLTLTWGHPPFQDWFPWEPTLENSHFCTTYYNDQEDVKTYPSCNAGVDCTNCIPGRWSWWFGWGQSCDSCCDNEVVVTKIVQKTKQVCCPGYFGLACERAFCAQPCPDNKTDCTAPNTCGPACYPPCLNGGTCTLGSPNNVCTCSPGWTGTCCETLMSCQATGVNQCQNGGICQNGRCVCQPSFTGVFCESSVSQP